MKYVDLLEKEVKERSFPNKVELKEYLDKVLNIIKSNAEIKEEFVERGLYSELDSSQKEFYNYYFKVYDKVNITEPSLNVDGVTSFTVGNSDFIKYQDVEGDYKIIEDNEPSKSYLDQIKEKQESSIEFQMNDAETNKQEILKSMTEERKEVELQSALDASYEQMSVEEIKDFNSIVNNELFEGRNLVFSSDRNIYLDKDTGEIFSVIVNENNLREIRKVNEDYTVSSTDEKITYDENLNQQTTEDVHPDIEYTSLTDSDLYYLVESDNQDIPFEARESAKREIERRKQLIGEEEVLSKKDKPKQYVLKIAKPYNGFVSFLMLNLITSLYGIGLLAYLYLLIK